MIVLLSDEPQLLGGRAHCQVRPVLQPNYVVNGAVKYAFEVET